MRVKVTREPAGMGAGLVMMYLCAVRQYIIVSTAVGSAVSEKHLTVVFLLSPQPFHAVCDLAASQVSLFGSGKFALQCTV